MWKWLVVFCKGPLKLQHVEYKRWWLVMQWCETVIFGTITAKCMKYFNGSIQCGCGQRRIKWVMKSQQSTFKYFLVPKQVNHLLDSRWGLHVTPASCSCHGSFFPSIDSAGSLVSICWLWHKVYPSSVVIAPFVISLRNCLIVQCYIHTGNNRRLVWNNHLEQSVIACETFLEIGGKWMSCLWLMS